MAWELTETKRKEVCSPGIIKRYCFHCKKVAKFGYCDNCSKMFCLSHAFKETEGNWESGYHTYLYHNCR